MGRIAAKGKFPSCKFVFPSNLDASLKEGQAFTIKMGINKLATGSFVNSTVKYFSAPQVRYSLRFLVQDFADGCIGYRPSTITG